MLEVRATRPYRTAADVEAIFQEIGAALASVPTNVRVVAVTDWRYCPLMSAEASELARARMAGNNARVERSAALASRESEVAVLQFLRLIRESGHPNRKLFFEADELISWLSEVLTPPEQQRLQDFLAEAPQRSALR
ncbi:MAG: hypothetical protein ACOY0T_19235 [Myxococcota bacterium]